MTLPVSSQHLPPPPQAPHDFPIEIGIGLKADFH
jgi:hypothetical protein